MYYSLFKGTPLHWLSQYHCVYVSENNVFFAINQFFNGASLKLFNDLLGVRPAENNDIDIYIFIQSRVGTNGAIDHANFMTVALGDITK